MKDKFRDAYISGLGEFLCYVTKNDECAKFVFMLWSFSLSGNTHSELWKYNDDFKRIKACLMLHRDGIRFFTMRMPFLFDCIRLLDKSGIDRLVQSDAYQFLLRKICGISSKRTLRYVSEFFNILNNGEKIPYELRRHYQFDKEFLKKPLLNVLVVGTMSSGKSTLINAIIGSPLNKVATLACTTGLSYVFNKPSPEGTLTYNHDKGVFYCDCTDGPVVGDASIQGDFLYAATKFDSQILECIPICLIDTPGVNNSDHHSHRQITHNAIKAKEYDLLLFVADSNYSQTEDEDDLLRIVVGTKKPIIFVLNKLDTFKRDHESIEKMVRAFEHRIEELQCKATVVPISAEVAYYARRNEKGLLSKDEMIEWQQYYKRFTNGQYYDLPSYYRQSLQQKCRTVLEKSGIPLLEDLLIEHTNIHYKKN